MDFSWYAILVCEETYPHPCILSILTTEVAVIGLTREIG